MIGIHKPMMRYILIINGPLTTEDSLQITLNFFDYLNDQYIVQIMNSKTRYCSNNERYTLKTLVLATSRLIIY